MKEITYAGTTFVTGDLIANSLLNLVEKLGTATATMHVEFPAVDGDSQSQALIDFVIGPSSEMVAMPVKSDVPEILDDEVVARLDRLARSLAAAHPVPEESPSAIDEFDSPDLV